MKVFIYIKYNTKLDLDAIVRDILSLTEFFLCILDHSK